MIPWHLNPCKRPFVALYFVVICLVLVSAPVSAQDAPDAGPQGRFKFGPLRFTPTIVLSSLGVDSNVFNEAVNPKQDTTAVLGPAVDLYMGLGRSQLTGQVGAEYMYFQTYTNQRGMNTANNLRWETRIGRVVPFVRGTYANLKGRPGFEIQSRVRQLSQSVTLGGELRVSGRTTILLTGTRSRLKYQDDAEFQGVNLSSALNESTNSEAAELRYRLTSLTTVVVNAVAMQDRFDSQRLRDSNSFRILPGLQLKKSALVSGNVALGFRRLASLDPSVPNFQGLVAQVDAKSVVRSRTQLGVQFTRDVAFSFQPAQPYYLLTDAGLTITERLGTMWDAVAHGSRQKLEYTHVRSVTPAVDVVDGTLPFLGTPIAGQRDTIRQVGGGIGYRFGRIMRLGVDVSYYRRSSSDPLFIPYEGFRVGATVSYGQPQ